MTYPAPKWLPSAYMDESVPPLRDSPEAWLTGGPDTGWRIAAGFDDQEDLPVLDGEVVPFDACVDLAEIEITVRPDGTVDLPAPLPPTTPPDGYSLTVSDGDDVWDSPASAANDLPPGRHTLMVYAWSERSFEFRLTNGRLVPLLHV